ncbi:MAG: ISL3 family transposase [Acidobacteria bacterium]|nr:ISL3 family transposase [Acidobacteriota bacterium]
MHFRSVLKKLVGVTQLYVRGLVMDRDDVLSIEVTPTWRKPRCAGCGRRAPQYDHPRSVGRWQDLNWGPVRIYLVYRCRRVTCAHCGGEPRTERLPWAAAGTQFTHRMEELTAFLARQTDITSVTRLLGIAWRTVGRIVRRVGEARLDPERYTGLTRIGVDEFSYRKRHHYLTVVLDHDTGKVVWAAKGKNAETLCTFFDLIGPEQCAGIQLVTIDMSAAYEKAITDRLPNATIIFDRFHVQQLSTNAVDEVRRDQQRTLRTAGDPDEAKVTKGTRFALLKNPWNLTLEQGRKLSAVLRNNVHLFRAYLLNQTLAGALDYRQPKRARRALDDWLSWACRSKLAPFVKVSRTIRAKKEGVLAYIRERLTNGIVEGTNNRLRMIARRAFGFHSPEALIAMLYLCCGGITLYPPLPQRHVDFRNV